MLLTGSFRRSVCNRQTLHTLYSCTRRNGSAFRPAVGVCRNMSQATTEYAKQRFAEKSDKERVAEYSDGDEKERIRKGKLPSHVNYGEEYWHKQRQEWLTPPDGEPPKRRRKKAVPINVAKFEELLRQPDKKQAFPHPVPLGQMIDIMTELWEDEGIFD